MPFKTKSTCARSLAQLLAFGMTWRAEWFAALLLLVPAGAGCRNGEGVVVSSDRGQPQAATPIRPAPSRSAFPEAPTPISEPPAPVKATWPPAPPAVASDFCIAGVHALDEETCYVLPARPTSELLLYLHGIVPPGKTSPQKTSFETVVLNASQRAGVAALMPRGELGLAPQGHAGWWGWPTSAGAHAEWTPKLLTKLADKRRKLEELVGRPFTRLYVAGSSSGAYFTIALALNGDINADGFAALSGAASRSQAFARVSPKPFYIGYGTLDTVGSAAQTLGDKLRQAGWPVKVAEHRLPHGTSEIYLDEAFAFWRSH